MFDTFRSTWARIGRWPRLLAAAACLVLAALSAVGAARDRAVARAPHLVAVVVTTHPVAAGRPLRAGDLRLEHWPAALHPPVTPADPRSLVGRRAAGALAAREPVTAPRVLGAGVTAGLPAGLRAVPIEVSGGRVAEYVRPGDHVDVLARPPADASDAAGGAGDGSGARDAGGAELVAGDATVLSVLPGSVGEAAIVVVAADRATALRVTSRETADSFTLVVIPP